MIIHCPRCGFSQPEDQYCAQCGLDIENYRPPEVPLFKKLFSNPVLQISAVLAIALSSGLYVYKHNRQEIRERVSFFRQGIQYNRNMNSSLPPPSKDELTEGQVADEDLPEGLVTGDDVSSAKTLEVSSATGASATNSAPIMNSGPAAPPASKATDGSRVKMRIQYVEVTEGTLAQIYSDSRSSGQFNSFGDHVAGVWPQGKKKAAGLRGWQVLSKEEKIYEEGRTLQFFAGLRGNDPENDLGLTTYIEITGVDTQGLHGHLEVVRTWRELSAGGTETPSIQRRFYPAAIDLGPEAYIFIAGALPRGTGMDADPYLTNMEPFKLLKNKNRSTEFLIVVDFDKDSQ